MEDIFCPLGPLPWALLTPEGLLRKTNKDSLATVLQRNVTTVEKLPEICASGVVGMGLVQRVKAIKLLLEISPLQFCPWP